MNGETPLIYVKRSKINEIFEYCLDNGIEFSVKERAMGIDEFEVSLEVLQIKKAIQLGAFLRENRLELVGSPNLESKSYAKKPAPKKTAEMPATLPTKIEVETPVTKTEPGSENAEPHTGDLRSDESLAENVSLSFDLN